MKIKIIFNSSRLLKYELKMKIIVPQSMGQDRDIGRIDS
jgi:hypothetical protein